MAKFVVDTNAVAGSAASLSSLAHEFDQQLEAANDAVMRVVGASWDGAAADAFAQSWQGFLTDSATVRAALAALISRMHAAEGTYEHTELNRTSAATAAAVGVRGLKRAPVNAGGGTAVKK